MRVGVHHTQDDHSQRGEVARGQPLQHEAERRRPRQAQRELRAGHEPDVDHVERGAGRRERHGHRRRVQEVQEAMVGPAQTAREQKRPEQPEKRHAEQGPEEGRQQVARADRDPGVVVRRRPSPARQQREQPHRGHREGQAGHRGQPGQRAPRPARGVEEIGRGQARPQDGVPVRERGQGQHERGQPRPPAARVRAVREAEEQHGQADAVRVRELARQRAAQRAAPDGVLLAEEEHQRGAGARERDGRAVAHEAEARVDEQRQREHARRGAELEGDGQSQGGHERGHQEQREREVVEQERMAEVAARVPAVHAAVREELLVEPDQRRVMRRRVAARGHGGEQQQRRTQVVEQDEQEESEADRVHDQGAVSREPAGHERRVYYACAVKPTGDGAAGRAWP